ncbi:hypothetical protein [Nocardioides sp.]|uniref:hypothetical protein n=1 Tax=Nocardioides sp. TaxID=35761 RepID=UPI003561FA0F
MHSPPPPRVRRTLLVVKAALLGACFTLTLGLGIVSTSGGEAPGRSVRLPEPAAGEHHARDVRRAIRKHGCSTTGLDPALVPATALVRTADGRLRHVSFERGWAVYTGARPGTLIAVCTMDGER